MSDLSEVLHLETAKGAVILRPERVDDEALLYRLFHSWAYDDLALMQADEATKENLVRFQFAGQTMTYRARYPAARFDIIEQDGRPIGRLIDEPGSETEPACLVDFVLLPEVRNGGLGRAIINAVLARYVRIGRKVRLKILYHNEPSQRMCAALGFVEIDRDLPFIQMEWSPPPQGA
ncbi:MAG TPA: GNAT family N-acetyltransferase [Reyranella sp.]|nr:GNAT family N-acetyltransferase [Reyranella sp.]